MNFVIHYLYQLTISKSFLKGPYRTHALSISRPIDDETLKEYIKKQTNKQTNKQEYTENSMLLAKSYTHGLMAYILNPIYQLLMYRIVTNNLGDNKLVYFRNSYRYKHEMARKQHGNSRSVSTLHM
jgi:hypothetical protein